MKCGWAFFAINNSVPLSTGMTIKNKSAAFLSVSVMIVLICFVLFCTLPTLLLVTSSLSDNDSVFRNGYSFWPKEWSLEAYRYMATQGQTIFRAYGISILTTFIGTISGLMLTAMLGYTLSRNELPGRKIINFLVFFTLLFNGGMVPTYLLYVNTLHVKNTIFALLLPNNILVNGFNVSEFLITILKNFYMFSPAEH